MQTPTLSDLSTRTRPFNPVCSPSDVAGAHARRVWRFRWRPSPHYRGIGTTEPGARDGLGGPRAYDGASKHSESETSTQPVGSECLSEPFTAELPRFRYVPIKGNQAEEWVKPDVPLLIRPWFDGIAKIMPGSVARVLARSFVWLAYTCQ